MGTRSLCIPKTRKNIKISLGPEVYVSQKLEKYQTFAWTRSLCIPKSRKISKSRLDPKLMYPKTLKNIKISLGPEACVSQNLEKYQKIAWTRSSCIPKPRKISKFRSDPKLVYPETSKKIKISLGPEVCVSRNLENYQNFAWTRSLCISKTRTISKFRLDPKL